MLQLREHIFVYDVFLLPLPVNLLGTVQKHIVPGLWFSSSISPSGAVLTPMDGLSVTCTAIKFEFNDPHKYQQKSGLSKAG